MNKPIRITHPLFKIINRSLIDLPSPSNISLWWNFGSLLGLCLSIQIITGIFLAMRYTANIEIAFFRVNHICRDVHEWTLLDWQKGLELNIPLTEEERLQQA